MGSDGNQDWARWQRPRPTRTQQRNDIGLGLTVTVIAVLLSGLAYSFIPRQPSMPTLVEQLVWVAAVMAPLLVRRRFPLTVLIIVGLLFIAAQARHVVENLTPSIALFLAMYTVGAWSRNRPVARWSRIVVIAGMFVWVAVSIAIAPDHEFKNTAGPVDPFLAAVLYGVVSNLLFFTWAYFSGNVAWTAARRQAELEQQAEQLRESQERNTHGAIVAERVRIARDLHDVVAHHVSVMGVQAGAARRVLEKDPQLTREALQTVEETARIAIGELRGLLGVLRAEDTDVPTTHPAAPGLEALPELVSATQAAQIDVTYGVYGEPRPVPDGVALSAYRVVQEALTNVVKHSKARSAVVRVRYLETALEVEVTDDGTGGSVGPSGFGLLGMRERVAVHGGELEAGPRRDGGYRVRVSLPTTVPEISTEDSEELAAS